MEARRGSSLARNEQGHEAVQQHLPHGLRADTEPANGPKSPEASQSREMRRTNNRSRYLETRGMKQGTGEQRGTELGTELASNGGGSNGGGSVDT